MSVCLLSSNSALHNELEQKIAALAYVIPVTYIQCKHCKQLQHFLFIVSKT